MDGFPDHRAQLPDECRRYWNVRDRLSVDDGLIVYWCRLLIPAAMHREVLSNLHDSHQGSVRTKERARLVYWPGLDNDLDNMLSSHVSNARITSPPTTMSQIQTFLPLSGTGCRFLLPCRARFAHTRLLFHRLA